MSAYDLDLHAWAHSQADALRRRSANEIDWENVAEEIESLGRQQRAQLLHRIEVLIMHLLKWAHQPNHQTFGWRGTIREQRRRIAWLLHENPSLRPALPEIFEKAYEFARMRAASETGLPESLLPETAPFSLDETLREDFLPEPITRLGSPPTP